VARSAAEGQAHKRSAAVIGRDGAALVVSRHIEQAPAGEQRVIVALAGELDQDIEALVRTILITALDEHRRVCVDLRDVTFFGAAGVNSVIAARVHADKTGSQFTVRGAHGIVRRVLAITGADHLMMVET
jgi:anti-sigma B factor antagonist